MMQVFRLTILAAIVPCALLSGCSRTVSAKASGSLPEMAAERLEQASATLPRPASKRVIQAPYAVRSSTPSSAAIHRAALADRRTRILVSTAERALWLMRDTTVLIAAPVAVGMHESFTWAGTTYNFKTPHGKRRVLAKGLNPVWVPPDWHYFEKAIEDNLDVVQLVAGQVVYLNDGTSIEVRGQEVGRVNLYGNFWPFTPGKEIIFDGKVFIPPMSSSQRRVADVLGTHKLEIGDGYLIHGTNEETSIGEAVSHGCVRLYNEDVVRLYEAVPTGTPVYIF